MRTKTTNKLFSLLTAALMVVSNISPVRVLAEGETPVVTWNGTEEAHVTVGEEIDFLAGVSATDGEGNELKVEIKGVTSDDESFAFEGQASLVATKAEVSYVVTYEALKDETPLAEGSKTFFVDKQDEGNIEESTDPLSNTESQEETEETSEEQPQETPAVLGANRAPLGNGGPLRAGGPTITATLVDETGTAIDFSSGTSGSQSQAVLKEVDTINLSGDNQQTFQTQYKLNVKIENMNAVGTGLNKVVEVKLNYGLEWFEDGTNLTEFKGALDSSQGTSGIEKDYLPGNYYRKDGIRKYHVLDGVPGFEVTFLIKMDTKLQLDDISNAIEITVSENNVKQVSTSLEKLKNEMRIPTIRKNNASSPYRNTVDNDLVGGNHFWNDLVGDTHSGRAYVSNQIK